jgi:hypothetical protein
MGFCGIPLPVEGFRRDGHGGIETEAVVGRIMVVVHSLRNIHDF